MREDNEWDEKKVRQPHLGGMNLCLEIFTVLIPWGPALWNCTYFQVLCPQNGTAVLQGLSGTLTLLKIYRIKTERIYEISKWCCYVTYHEALEKTAFRTRKMKTGTLRSERTLNPFRTAVPSQNGTAALKGLTFI